MTNGKGFNSAPQGRVNKQTIANRQKSINFYELNKAKNEKRPTVFTYSRCRNIGTLLHNTLIALVRKKNNGKCQKKTRGKCSVPTFVVWCVN